jgi:hypothetical protein
LCEQPEPQPEEKPANLMFKWNQAYMSLDTKPGIECREEYEYCVENFLSLS